MSGRYPSDEELRQIEDWDVLPRGELKKLFKFVQSIWAYPDCATFEAANDPERNAEDFVLVTCGWSGNEDIVYSLKRNTYTWIISWDVSKRGGYHRFRVPRNFCP